MKKDLIKIAETTLQILSKKSWNLLSLNDVKKKSKVKDFDEKIKYKKFLLKNINNYFDYTLSFNVKKIEKSDQKDMIFEIFMMRFDILQQNRNAINSIFKAFKTKPHELIFLLPPLLNSMEIISKYVNISLYGILGQIKLKGLLIIYFSTFLIWIKDDSESLEKTMTALDRYLDQAGKIFKYIK